MKRVGIGIVILGLVVCGLIWFAWVKPKPVDMASFAPSNCLLYLEVNHPPAVFQALEQTDAWRLVDQNLGRRSLPSFGGRLHELIRLTGIGPIETVLMSRSQLAIVVTNVGTTADGETLNVKPDVALILQTHTSERRIRAPIERFLSSLATKAFGSATSRISTINGVELLEWVNPDGTRRIVATFSGSLAIIGNSEHSVLNCLNVGLKRAHSLREDLELHKARAEAESESSLAFGFVPASESAKLVALGLPIMLGRPPGDPGMEGLITRGAASILGNVSWSSRSFKGGVEDRYRLSLRPGISDKFKPNLVAPTLTITSYNQHFHSLTHYKFAEPLEAWNALKTAVSSNVDAMSAVLFNSILKASLVTYGITEPDTFLSALEGDVITMRLDSSGDRQLLVAHVRDSEGLRALFQMKLGFHKPKSGSADIEVFESSDGDTGVALHKSIIVVGHPSDVQQYFQSLTGAAEKQTPRRFEYYSEGKANSHVTTFSDDAERVRAFIDAVLLLIGGSKNDVSKLEAAIDSLPFAVTETTWREEGIERVTRSPLGQFSTLVPLFIPKEN